MRCNKLHGISSKMLEFNGKPSIGKLLKPNFNGYSCEDEDQCRLNVMIL